MIGKTFTKISSSKHDELIETLGEDKALELLKYCYKAFETYHREDQELMEAYDCRKTLSFVNAAFPKFYTSGICATAFERGDPLDES